VHPAAGPVASSADVVETCERNRLEVMEPNVEQLEMLQKRYRALQKNYSDL